MKKIVLNNLGLKLLSLCFAILLWLFISARGTSEINLEVAIEYINIPTGYEILQKDIDKVNVSIFGSERILRSIKHDDLRVIINLKNGTTGRKTYTIKKKNIIVPPAITVSSVSPSSVTIIMDKTIKKEVPVKPEIIDSSQRAKDFTIIMKPEKVIVEGPESILKKVEFVKTEPIDISNIKEGISKKLPLISDINKMRIMTDSVELCISSAMEGK